MTLKIAAEGSGEDRVRIVIDEVAYGVSRKKAEIHYEGSDPADLHMLLCDPKHRGMLADKASIIHRENGESGWLAERPESWNVHYGSKTLKVMWDGSIAENKKEASVVISSIADAAIAEARSKSGPSAQEWISAKIKKLRDEGKSPEQAAAIAYSMAREKGYKVPEKKADLLDEVAKQLGKSRQDLTPADIEQAHEAAKRMLPSSPAAPVAPAHSPSMTPPSNMAPLAPGQSSVAVRWMRAADENPFAKKDDKAEDKKEEKDEKKEDKGDKKAPPFGKKDDKKDDKKDEKPTEKPSDDKKEPAKKEKKDSPKEPSKSDEKKDVDLAEKTIKDIEKLIEREEKEGEGGPHIDALKDALKHLKMFLGEEEHELAKAPADGIPMKVDMDIVGPAGPVGPIKPPMAPAIPSSPVPQHPIPLSSQDDSLAGFREGEAVWHKDMVDATGFCGEEPGRVIAIGGGKIVVDWGGSDDVPTEYDPSCLVKAEARIGEADLFSAEGSEVAVIDEEPQVDDKSNIETILSGLSLKDMLAKSSSAGSNKNAIEHIATGSVGEFLANASDGRCLVRIDQREIFVYPYEIKFKDQQPLF